MKRSTILGIALALGVGLYCKFKTEEIEARIQRDDAIHAQSMMGLTSDLSSLSAIGGGVLSFPTLLSAPPSFFSLAELSQVKSGTGKPVTTQKTQEDRNRTASKNTAGTKVSKSRVPHVIAKTGRGVKAAPLSTRSFESWRPCILSTYWEWENGTRTASGVPFSDEGLTVAVHNGSRRILLNHHIEIRYGNKTVRALVTDVFIRWDLKERLDCSPRLKYLLTGERGGLTKGAWFRIDR